MKLVLDASAAIAACLADDGFEVLSRHELVAPALMWSEARSTLHELLWRREIGPKDAEAGRRALAAAPVRRVARRRLGEEAWRLADRLGWAKTYDAEYLALARLLDCRVLTVDGRMRRGAARLGLVLGPDELGLGG